MRLSPHEQELRKTLRRVAEEAASTHPGPATVWIGRDNKEHITAHESATDPISQLIAEALLSRNLSFKGLLAVNHRIHGGAIYSTVLIVNSGEAYGLVVREGRAYWTTPDDIIVQQLKQLNEW